MDQGEGRSSADWAEWFDRLAPALLLFARQWTDSLADAEDVVQDVFVKFWKSTRGTPAEVADPRAYLFSAVKRATLDLRRGNARRERRERSAVDQRRPEPSLFATEAERDEWRVLVESALAGLPEPQREVLVLKIWGGLTFPQIAEVTGVSANTAASRYRYALESLRRRLAEETVS
ncbi:MAG: sigma-70 family RNA polymerase sigma factor [Isosphaeraceae bacterium]